MLATETITGQTAAGLPATVTVQITGLDPVPSPTWQQWPPPMVVGANIDPSDRATVAPGGALHGARIARTFCAPGDGILPRDHPNRRLPAGVAEHISFKDWRSDTAVVAALNTLLDEVPASLLATPLLPELAIYNPDGYPAPEPDDAAPPGFSLLLTYFHEGEKDFLLAGLTAREWRRRHRLVYRTIRAHRNGYRVGYVPIQTSTWTEAASTPDKPKGDFDPFAWWAGVGDYAGYDLYQTSNTTAPPSPELYRPADAFLATAMMLSAGTGRRLFVPELGVIRQGSPPEDGRYRAAWIRQVVAALRDHGVAAVSWWHDHGANNRDFRLTDQASLTAWQDAIAARI